MSLRREALTELEAAVLGKLWLDGPCTAYVVRRVFLDSPSPWWSGSAGAVYPLLARLERAGLVRSSARRADRRRSRLLALTPAGRRRLEDWLGPPLPEWVVGVPMDALRTRLGLIAALRPERRRRLFAEAERGVSEQLERVEQDLARAQGAGVPWELLIAEGAAATQRVRLEWVKRVRRRLGKTR
jgi:DNA-binding PadR family transcriptional regulator